MNYKHDRRKWSTCSNEDFYKLFNKIMTERNGKFCLPVSKNQSYKPSKNDPKKDAFCANRKVTCQKFNQAKKDGKIKKEEEEIAEIICADYDGFFTIDTLGVEAMEILPER